MTQHQLRQRPLSPHISRYKPQITSTLSILHRITGVILYLGLILFTWLFVSQVYGYDVGVITSLLQSFVGKLVILGWAFTLYYHLLNGIRHLFWDIGKGYSLQTATASGYAVVIGALLLSAASVLAVLNLGS